MPVKNHFSACPLFATVPAMTDEQLNAIAEFELQEDLRQAQNHAVSLGLLERDEDGTVTITLEGERQFWTWVHSPQNTAH